MKPPEGGEGPEGEAGLQAAKQNLDEKCPAARFFRIVRIPPRNDIADPS